MTDSYRPIKPSDPRPNNEPFYVEPNCSICGTALVLNDLIDGPVVPPRKVWNDEWVCPNHRDEGVVMDWPPEHAARMRGRKFQMDTEPEKSISLTDALAEHGVSLDELLEHATEEQRRAFDQLPPIKLHPSAVPEFLDMLRSIGREPSSEESI